LRPVRCRPAGFLCAEFARPEKSVAGFSLCRASPPNSAGRKWAAIFHQLKGYPQWLRNKAARAAKARAAKELGIFKMAQAILAMLRKIGLFKQPHHDFNVIPWQDSNHAF